MSQNTTQLELARRVMRAARDRGAEIAEVVVVDEADLTAKVRMGETELVQEARSVGVGLRVFRNGRQANSTTSNTTGSGLDELVGAALELADLAEPDEFAGPPDAALLHRGALPELELFDESVAGIDGVQAVARARECEDAARSFDPRIVNSEGATFSRTTYKRALVTSGGFEGETKGSFAYLGCAPIVEDTGGKRQRGSYWDSRRFLTDLSSGEQIGAESAKRAIQKLGAMKIPSAELPIVFEPDAARALLSLLCSSVSGDSIYKRTSYLAGELGNQIGSSLVTIEDDPTLLRGAGSRAFDGEGLTSRVTAVVTAGKLENYLLDTYSCKKLGLGRPGNAGRGLSAKPGVSSSNFVLQKGTHSPRELIKDISRGLFVTHMMGFGFNATTGDFSRGAEGFLIENGELTQPVSEVTVSLGFRELWNRIDAVGDDVDTRSRFRSPSFRVSRMTVAGSD